MTDAPDIEQKPADAFISTRKSELVAALRQAGGLAAPDAAALGDLFRLLGAVLHYEAHDRLERLKDLYAPLDPDARAHLRANDPAAFETFETAMADALRAANFSEIDLQSVQTLRATKILTGLAIKASSAGIRRVRFFARGARPQQISSKTWFGLRTEVVDANVWNDVIVLVGFKGAAEIEPADRRAFAKMRRGVRPGATLVKHFRNVAQAELVTLHPGARPAMRTRDQVFLAAPAIAGGVPVLLQIGPALTVLFAVIAAYFGAGQVIDNERLKSAVAALGGLAAVGAFVMRQRLKYEAQTLKYQKTLADTVYFRNLANNAGVLDMLVGAGEDQDAKEAFLAYWALLKAGKALNKAEIDGASEAFLCEHFKLKVDFEIEDGLAKLERLGLVTAAGGMYAAKPVAEALRTLDAAWDSYFKYSGAAAAS